MRLLSTVIVTIIVITNSYGQARITVKNPYLFYQRSSNYTYKGIPAEVMIQMLDRGLEKEIEARGRFYQMLDDQQKAKIQRLQELYFSFDTYPSKVKDGWHSVFVTDGNTFIEVRKVYVQNNKITKYFVDDWNELRIDFTAPISEAVALIKVKESAVYIGEYLEVCFLEYLADPNHRSSGPAKKGEVVFYSAYKKGGAIRIYIDGKYMGSVTNFISKKSKYKPGCGPNGFLRIKYKEGKHTIYAYNEKGYEWNGTITIYGNDCYAMEIER